MLFAIARISRRSSFRTRLKRIVACAFYECSRLVPEVPDSVETVGDDVHLAAAASLRSARAVQRLSPTSTCGDMVVISAGQNPPSQRKREFASMMGGGQLKGVFYSNRAFLFRYQGELLGLWDPQNRDLRRKPPPETKFLVGLLSPPSGCGVLISGYNM